MSHAREQFNAKARQSSAGSRRKSKRKRVEGQPVGEDDPNKSILVPKTKEQKEQERKEKLRQEVCVRDHRTWTPQYDYD